MKIANRSRIELFISLDLCVFKTITCPSLLARNMSITTFQSCFTVDSVHSGSTIYSLGIQRHGRVSVRSSSFLSRLLTVQQVILYVSQVLGLDSTSLSLPSFERWPWPRPVNELGHLTSVLSSFEQVRAVEDLNSPSKSTRSILMDGEERRADQSHELER